MSETLGSLIDRLVTTNLKLWFVQDEVNHAAELGEGVDAETTFRLVVLNRLRNSLMTDIDKAGGGKVEERIKM